MPRAIETTRLRARFETKVALTVVVVSLVPLGAMLLLGQELVQVATLGLTVVPAALIAWWAARSVTQRVKLLAIATARVGQGDLSVRVRPRGNDEVDELMRAFNAMVGDMQIARARIEYLQKIGAWQDFARCLAHEIKNPLTPIQLAIQEVAKKYPGDDPAFARTLVTAREVIEEEVETLRRLVVAFSNFARLPDVKTEPGDLAEFVRDAGGSRGFLDDAAADAGHVGAGADAIVAFEPGSEVLPVAIDRTMLRRALDNLVRNATQAGAKHVWVRAQKHGEQAWLIVDDDGPGVPEARRAQIFEPYYTTKEEGTGLGLAIVRKIAFDHNGDVGLEQNDDRGARFVITLPIAGPTWQSRLTFVTFSGSERVVSPVPVRGNLPE